MTARHPLSVVGSLLGFFLLGKGLLTIVAAELYFDVLEFCTRLVWNSSAILVAERAVEDIFLAQGILSASLGIMCLLAGYLNDVRFFTFHFMAFSVSSIIFHSWFLSSTGAMKTSSMHLIVHVVEMTVVVAILLYFNIKNFVFGGMKVVSDEKKMD